METIQQMWEGYVAKVLAPLGPTISPVQYTETRRAFYAGFFSMLSACERIGEDDISEDRGVGYLEARKREVTRFFSDVQAGKA